MGAYKQSPLSLFVAGKRKPGGKKEKKKGTLGEAEKENAVPPSSRTVPIM